MKKRVLRNLKTAAKQLIFIQCIATQIAIGFANAAPGGGNTATKSTEVNRSQSQPAQTPPLTEVKVNRTVPRVEPPRDGLEFSAKPTVQELFRARVFEEPLVPVGGEPTEAENVDLAAALLGYSKRSGPDDFGSLTGFLDKHPRSPWQAALLTDLGLEYYNTAHYSLALDAWKRAWLTAKDATDQKGKAIGDRAVGELAYMYARLGRMTELEPLLQTLENRVFIGPATEKIAGARGGLASMKERPEISFRCGPLALHQIKLSTDPKNAGTEIIYASASTKKGFSLSQVAALSNKLGLNYQMAYRAYGADLVVPSVVHWKVGHYAALIRQEGDRYLIQDPTFRNDVWATERALQAETSGYFLVPPGSLPKGWRSVAAAEGEHVWGKGNVDGADGGGGGGGCSDPKTVNPNQCCGAGGGGGGGGGGAGGGGPPPDPGMAVSSVDLLFVSLSLTDVPVPAGGTRGPL